MQSAKNRKNGTTRVLNRAIFKAYDVRGRYPEELNERTAREIGRRLARRLFKSGTIVVGHDARSSSPALYRALRAGLSAGGAGARTVPVGFSSTPMLYFLVNRLEAAGGIEITASHNPKEYNGFKVVGRGSVIISGHELLKRIR